VPLSLPRMHMPVHMAARTQRIVSLLLLANHATASFMLPQPSLARHACDRRRAIAMQVGSEQQEPSGLTQPGAEPVSGTDTGTTGETQPPVGEDGSVDLASMSFDERLAYLSSQTFFSEPPPKVEDEVSMFGIDGENKATQFWRPEFLKLCLDDLREMTWPSRKQTLQTVTVSQAAFVVIIILILIFDAVVEAGVRSLLQGRDFTVGLDAVFKKEIGASL